MKIKKIHIKNFRSIKDQEVDCGNQTIFIGGNGTGKSTVLKALQVFFDLTFKPTIEDYFAHNPKEPIEVTVVFAYFTETEQKDFESRIHNDEMSITRAFGGEGAENGTYHGLITGCPSFQPVRTASNATDKQAAYKKLIEGGYELPKWTKQADAEKELEKWEENNSEKCTYIKDGGQFFGPKNIGGGKLQKASNFIMIEAVRDVSEDANDQKSSAIGQLMDLIVRSAMMQNARITQYQDEVNQQYATLTNPDNFPQLGSLQTALTNSLKTYYQDMGVKLNWQETGGVVLPPPQAQIKFQEDNFEFPVSKAGNGVQRAFIISLLHQLLVAKSNNAEASAEAANQNKPEDDEALPEPSLLKKLPSVILAIEEPELYQHPTKQWHFAQVLKRLSSGELEDTFGDVQVLFCTHSPNFVDLSEFHNTRITTKEVCEDTQVKHTLLRDASIADVAKMIEKTWEFTEGTCTEESTKARLHIFGTELSEGFFSDGVILVEGVTDKAALETIANLKGKSFAENNVAVLSVNGKSNMDRPWMVFTQLGIPVFPMWDTDANCDKDNELEVIRTNKALQRMLGIAEADIIDLPAGVYQRYACFQNDLNEQLRADFGDTDYNASYLKALDDFDLISKQGKKNPYVLSSLIRYLYAENKQAETLEAIIDAAFLHIFPKQEPSDAKKVA